MVIKMLESNRKKSFQILMPSSLKIKVVHIVPSFRNMIHHLNGTGYSVDEHLNIYAITSMLVPQREQKPARKVLIPGGKQRGCQCTLFPYCSDKYVPEYAVIK